MNENCHYDDIEWCFAFTFHMAFKNIVDTGTVFEDCLKQELLEFRRLEHFIHALIKDMLMQCSLKMAGNFLRRDGTGGHIIGFQKLCFESQYCTRVER